MNHNIIVNVYIIFLPDFSFPKIFIQNPASLVKKQDQKTNLEQWLWMEQCLNDSDQLTLKPSI